ncbi:MULTISPECIES: ABC transporter substrate-binding protein [unclassified Amycolatopsis]|uniref:ABC transporter substrate-binding protein n=1 Tax=unclassified Amycolatopsis TaxID=2618356 RepID=UPI001C6A75EA|nr:hypothetical protein [Amycolatopsis sp. DSM 110486]QYN18097.1 hypothetical protein K1T34_35865 [Amycolatopsis sp. DSM 110486]
MRISKRLRLGGVLVAAGLLASALTACAGSSSEGAPIEGCAKTTNIQIATTPYQDSLIMSLGNQLGWYKQACLNVTFQNVALTNISKIVASGHGAPVGWRTSSEINQAQHLDSDLIYLYPWDICSSCSALMARPGTGLKSYTEFKNSGMSREAAIAAVINELHGKSIVTTLKNSRAEVIQSAIQSQGKPLDWASYVDLDPASGYTAFLSGTGDTYIAGLPQQQPLADKGYKNLLTGAELSPPPLNGFLTTKTYWNENKDALLSLIHVTFMAIRYTDANRDAVAKYVSDTYNKQTGSTLTVADFNRYWQNLETYPANAGDAQKKMFTPGAPAYWRTIWDEDNNYFFTNTHIIPEPAPASAFLGEEVQKAYVAKYGADETGWTKPTGNL